MHFTIVGAGALGTILAAHLAAAGHQVACVVRDRRAKQLDFDGLHVEGLSQLNERCEIVTDPKSVLETDVLVIGTKTYQTELAIAPLCHLKPGLAFSMANGVKKTAQLRKAFGEQCVIGCMANVSGELLDNGHVHYTRNVCLHLGALHEVSRSKTKALAEAIDKSGIICRASDSIETIEWSKYVGWVAFMALSVITRARTIDFLQNANHVSLACRLIKEMAAIAKSKGIPLIDQSPMPVKTIAESSDEVARQAIIGVGREFAASAPDHRMSSLQDLERGAKLEFEDTLGYAVELAHELKLAAPTIHDCYDLVAGIDSINQI